MGLLVMKVIEILELELMWTHKQMIYPFIIGLYLSSLNNILIFVSILNYILILFNLQMNDKTIHLKTKTICLPDIIIFPH